MRTIYFMMFAFITANAFGQCGDINLPATVEICRGETVTLTAADSNESNYTYKWFIGTRNFAFERTNMVTVGFPGDLRVEATNITSGIVCTANTTIIINDLPDVPSFVTLVTTDTDCDGFASFDLTSLTASYMNGNTNYNVQYFPTIIDAENDTNVVIGNYTNTNSVTDEVTVKVTDLDTGCFDTGTIELVVEPQYTITSLIESTTPATVNNIIEICQGDSISFTAEDNSSFNFEWDFERLGRLTGRTVTQQFNESGGYIVRLVTTDQNSCPSAPVDYVTVVVSENPDIDFVAIDAPVLCLGDTIEVMPASLAAPVLVCNNITDYSNGRIFLPDGGSSQGYQFGLEIDCFPEGAMLNNTNSFLGVCLSIEHTNLGDLRLELIAPDGSTMELLDFPNNGQGLSLGERNLTSNSSIITGYEYCFTTQSNIDIDNNSGLTTVPSGNYSINEPLSNLSGVPLNGLWKLRIVDNLLSDNGYLFNWKIKFGANIETTTGYTSPAITSESWATHPDITILSSGGVTITPSQTGINCYDYTTTDASGCTFINQYCIEVRDPQTDFPTVDLYIYDSDANGTEDFNLDFNTDRLIGNMDAATTTVTYYTTLADAQNQSNPIFNTDSFANTTNPQTIYASVNNSNLLCQNVIVDFDLILTNQPVTDSDNDTIPDLSEDLNGNGDLTDDDTDGDGIPNYLDDDDDGDGVPTAVETSGVGARGTNFTFIDTDGDGIENYLDNDDDGDGVLTEDEDYNGNGDPTDDDTDGSGIPDFLENNVTLRIESLARDAFVIFPNPFYENNFEIRYSNSTRDTLKATLYDMNGASVLTKSYPINESGTIKVETPNLTSGIYFLQLNINQNSVYKLIKK